MSSELNEVLLGTLKPRDCFTLALLGGAGDLFEVLRPFGKKSMLVKIAIGGDPEPMLNSTPVIPTRNLLATTKPKNNNRRRGASPPGLFD